MGVLEASAIHPGSNLEVSPKPEVNEGAEWFEGVAQDKGAIHECWDVTDAARSLQLFPALTRASWWARASLSSEGQPVIVPTKLSVQAQSAMP